jgi:hypothetical protein
MSEALFGWMLLLTIGLILVAVALGFVAANKRDRGSRRGRRGPKGASGNVGPTGSTGPASVSSSTGGGSSATTMAYTFTNAGGSIYSNAAGDLTIVSYGSNQITNSFLEAAAPGLAVIVPQAGYLHGMHLSLQYTPNDVQSASAATGLATLYKTDGCATGFHPTNLQVEWGVPPGNVDGQTNCIANITDLVDVNPSDRFVIVFAATGPTGPAPVANLQYGIDVSISLLYTVD